MCEHEGQGCPGASCHCECMNCLDHYNPYDEDDYEDLTPEWTI